MMSGREVVVVVSGVLLLAANFVACKIGKHEGRSNKGKFGAFDEVGLGGPGPQSPVRIVGGSIKLRASDGWNACQSSSTPCIVSAKGVNTAYLAIEGGDSANAEPTAWVNVSSSYNWTIKVWARDIKYQKKKGTGGIQICTSDLSGACAAAGTRGAYVTITTIGKSQGNGASLDLFPETPDSNTGYRYADSAVQKGNFVESIHSAELDNVDSISASTPYTYTCDDGACNIYIGK
jgi:hypothetical protein